MSQRLMRLLRLRTLPVGVKLFERRSEIPKSFEMIEEECSVCQVIGIARYLEKAVAAVKEGLTTCPVGCFSLCMCDLPMNRMLCRYGGLPYQMESFAYASVWHGGNRLELSTNGHGASCNEVLGVPYLTGRVRLAIADQGDRWHGFATEEEMILGCSLAELERLTVNLWESMQNIYYPRNYDPLKLTYNPKYSARTYQGTE